MVLRLMTQKKDGDTIVIKNGVKLLIDPMSFQYLSGAEIDYSDGIEGVSICYKKQMRQLHVGVVHLFQFRGLR